MRKVFKSKKHKKFLHRKIKKRNRKFDSSRSSFKKNDYTVNDNKPRAREKKAKQVKAPENLKLLQNTESAIGFLQRIYDKSNHGYYDNFKFVDISFEKVTKIDYSMISVLISLFDEFRNNNIFFKISLPKQEKSRKYINEAGLLNGMYDDTGKLFKTSKKSNQLFFEKGSGKLTREENIKITNSVRSIVKHLSGLEGNCGRLKTILLEICGNAIEWSGDKQQWSLGIKFEDSKVIVTVTDLGTGILNTLNRKFRHLISDVNEPSNKVLSYAFDRKYGSKSKKVNRNKGLPCVKASFTDNKIGILRVLTNNVLLDFNNTKNSRTLKHYAEFPGTLYRWEVNLLNLNS